MQLKPETENHRKVIFLLPEQRERDGTKEERLLSQDKWGEIGLLKKLKNLVKT